MTSYARYPTLLSRPRQLAFLAVAALLIAPALGGCGKSDTSNSSSKSSSDMSMSRPADPNDPVVAKVNGVDM